CHSVRTQNPALKMPRFIGISATAFRRVFPYTPSVAFQPPHPLPPLTPDPIGADRPGRADHRLPLVFGNRPPLDPHGPRKAPRAPLGGAHLLPLIRNEAAVSLPLQAAVSTPKHDNKPVFTDISRSLRRVRHIVLLPLNVRLHRGRRH